MTGDDRAGTADSSATERIDGGQSPAGTSTVGPNAGIEISSVTVSFGNMTVLDDVSVTIESGEFVGVIGPNGAGKTTLLRTITGAITPDRGTVAIGDDDVHHLSSRASSRRVAVVPQDTTLSFSFTVRDVVEMGRHPYRSRFAPPSERDGDCVDDALDRTRTAQFATRPIEELSGGERQRVVLARAIAQDAPVLVLDEPTASLDINHRVEMLELVRELVDTDGRTVVAAIHDLNMAARYCDRLVLVADGTVTARGPPASVLSADTLERAFGANAAVTENTVTRTTTVTALPHHDSAALPDSVHVLGTGTTAAGVLARIDTAGVDTSLGPVPSGSAAAETAAQLGVDAIDTEPFAPLAREAQDALDCRLESQDVVVLADLEVGAGNQVVLDRLCECASLVVVESRPFADRNFAGDGARRRYEQLRERSVRSSPDRLLETLEAVAESGGSTPSTRGEGTGSEPQPE